jgi:hypothetical protein
MDKLLDMNMNEIHLTVQALMRGTHIHTYRHTDGISEPSLSYSEGLKMYKYLKILRSVFFTITILFHVTKFSRFVVFWIYFSRIICRKGGDRSHFGVCVDKTVVAFKYHRYLLS